MEKDKALIELNDLYDTLEISASNPVKKNTYKFKNITNIIPGIIFKTTK
jgi:hypothetical protein